MARRRREKDEARAARAADEAVDRKRRRAKGLLLLGSVLVVVALLLLAILFPPLGGVGRGDPAPDFTVTDVDGGVFRLSAHRGAVVLIDWMGVNCPPCRAQMPELVRLHADLGPRGLVLISIDMGEFGALAAENEDEARAFMDEFGATWPIALERTGLATRYGVVNIPTLLIVDPEGVIVFKQAGVHTAEDLQAVIAPHLPT